MIEIMTETIEMIVTKILKGVMMAIGVGMTGMIEMEIGHKILGTTKIGVTTKMGIIIKIGETIKITKAVKIILVIIDQTTIFHNDHTNSRATQQLVQIESSHRNNSITTQST